MELQMIGEIQEQIPQVHFPSSLPLTLALHSWRGDFPDSPPQTAVSTALVFGALRWGWENVSFSARCCPEGSSAPHASSPVPGCGHPVRSDCISHCPAVCFVGFMPGRSSENLVMDEFIHFPVSCERIFHTLNTLLLILGISSPNFEILPCFSLFFFFTLTLLLERCIFIQGIRNVHLVKDL